jgi:hypothetical protein
VLDADGVEPAVVIRQTDVRILLEQAAADRNFGLARVGAEQNRRHRADADAAIRAELLRMVTTRR